MTLLPASGGLLLLCAALLDFGLRLPNALHPVAWFGKLAGAIIARAPLAGRVLPGIAGLLIALVLPAAAAISVKLFLDALHSQTLLGFTAQTFFLASSFTLFGLLDAARALELALTRDGLQAARARLSWLCSRDPSALDESGLANGTIESLAENFSDSVVAPLFYLLLFGIEGAIAYRAINTLDAMIGYRGRYEWLGKAAARLDDLANLLPARLSVLLLALASLSLRDTSLLRGGQVWWRDHANTQSPNAGHPMAFTAGALGIRLDKPPCYTLAHALHPPLRDDIERARKLVGRAGMLTLAVATWLAHRYGFHWLASGAGHA